MSIKLELNSEYIEKLKTLIKHGKSEKLIENLNTIHTADIAEIFEILDKKEAQYLYKLITDKERLAAIIIELDDETREKLLEDLTANEIANTDELKDLLIKQIENRVRWRESVINMINSDVNHFIEIGPGKVLSGLVKRINKEVKIDNINNQGDIESLKI